jgi:hypothetical protein
VATLRVARTVHVEVIDPAYRQIEQGYEVRARIRIVYGNGPPVVGAEVTVQVIFPDGGSQVVTVLTGPHGIAVVSGTTPDTGTYTFTILGVTAPPAVYDPTENVETSDSITIR